MRAILTLALLLGVALAAAGCKAKCEDLCKKNNECPNFQQTDCKVYCNDLQTYADTSKCNEKHDKFLQCISDGIDKVCTDLTLCDAEFNSFNDCIKSYCASNPTSPICI